MSEHLWTKETDKQHKILLKSHLIYAIWQWPRARGGSEIDVEVRTSFVGDGAKLELTFRGERSKKFGTLTDTIFSNRYRGTVVLPPDFESGEDIWFDVKLSKQGVKGESNRIPAYPMPLVHSLSWNQKTVHRGDTLHLTGEFSRIENYAECVVTIYEYDEAGIHDKLIEIPSVIQEGVLDLHWEFQYGDDTAQIPTQEEMERVDGVYQQPQYFFVVNIDGCKFGEEQESGVLVFEEVYSAVVYDCFSVPIANQRVILHLASGDHRELRSDKDGKVYDPHIKPGQFQIEVIDEDGK